MKNVAMIPFKLLVKEYIVELSVATMEYIQSDEFKKSEYDLYSEADLIDAIKNEEFDNKRLALVCLLHYKAERGLFSNRANQRL